MTRKYFRDNPAFHEFFYLLRREMAADTLARCASDQCDKYKDEKNFAECFHAPNYK